MFVRPQQNIDYYRETLIKMQEDFSKKFLFFQIQLKYNWVNIDNY